jgi:hypothetical protein
MPEDAYAYRGLQRREPNPPLHSEGSTIFELWQKSSRSEDINNKGLDNLNEAIALWKALSREFACEIIGVERNTSSSPHQIGTLIGFDVAEVGEWISLLSWNWYATPRSTQEHRPDCIFWDLICEHFYSRLNSNRLFADLEVAQWFADCCTALNSLAPGFLEDYSSGYKVFAIYAFP